MKAMEITTIVLGAILILLIASTILALPVYWLWNWLVPSIFGLRSISLLEALGLLMLSGLLFRPSYNSDTNKK